jgi:hypothetical protein
MNYILICNDKVVGTGETLQEAWWNALQENISVVQKSHPSYELFRVQLEESNDSVRTST